MYVCMYTCTCARVHVYAWMYMHNGAPLATCCAFGYMELFLYAWMYMHSGARLATWNYSCAYMRLRKCVHICIYAYCSITGVGSCVSTAYVNVCLYNYMYTYGMHCTRSCVAFVCAYAYTRWQKHRHGHGIDIDVNISIAIGIGTDLGICEGIDLGIGIDIDVDMGIGIDIDIGIGVGTGIDGGIDIVDVHEQGE